MAKVDAIKRTDGDHGVGNVARRYDIVKNIHFLKCSVTIRAAKIGKK
jgi:hypothetical protein